MMAEMSVIRDGITSNSADLTECPAAALPFILVLFLLLVESRFVVSS